MLKQRHRQDHEISPEAEARIRADERRRVLAERDAGTEDWRTTPPDPGEPRIDDPATAVAPTRLADDDPRGWDVHDGRADADRIDRDDRPAYGRDSVREEVVTERGFSPGQILIFLAGAASLVLGILAVVRTGLDGSLSDPVEQVLWWDHTALLGLIEIGAGAVMILGALHPRTRWLSGLVGLAAIAGGVLILAELDWTIDELGAERDFGWVVIAIGAVAVVGAAIPRVRRTRRVTTVTDTIH